MVRLPTSTWTQRYLQAGCGGFCGADQVTLSVVAAEGSDQYENGHFAVATTDMDGDIDGSFALNEDAFIDFAYLAVHNTAEVSKALIKQYYGQEQAYAYFNGCSDGGRESVMSALRYPNDFNGIVAGAPAFLLQFQNSFHHAWVAHSNLDANDEPDLQSLAWVGVGIPATDGGAVLSESIALSALRYLIFEDAPAANYTLDDFVFANSTIDLLRPHHPFLDAVSPDLSAFHEADGKLILWHGWADQHISPRTTIQYHEKLIDTMGADAVEDFNRMYIFPGVWHCGSGEGMASFDLLTPMLDWVEAGSVPHEIVTSTEEDSSASGSSTPPTALVRRTRIHLWRSTLARVM